MWDGMILILTLKQYSTFSAQYKVKICYTISKVTPCNITVTSDFTAMIGGYRDAKILVNNEWLQQLQGEESIDFRIST